MSGLGAVLMRVLQFAFTWVFQTAIPFIWRSVILRVLQFIWNFCILRPFQWAFSILAFMWRYILHFIRMAISKPIPFLLMGLFHLLFGFGAFFKWAFLILFALVLYKVLDVFGINIFTTIFDYLLLAFSVVLDFVITLIFGMINFEEIVGFVNEQMAAMPDCVLAIMFAVGLSEALNSIISSAILFITLRFALFVFRR